MKPLSRSDLREAILAAVVTTARDHDARSPNGSASTSRPSPGCSNSAVETDSIRTEAARRRQEHPVLDPDGLERLRHLVEEHPDATLGELRGHLGVGGSLMIVWRALKKLGITRKKKTKHAAERDRPDVQQRKRRAFREKDPADRARGETCLGVDETGVTTAMTPTYGRAPRGERVLASAPASWESVTVIAAVGLDGVRSPLAVPGAATRRRSWRTSRRCLARARPGDVVVFDNLASHFTPGVAEAIERAGATVFPLPPYSPDFNPIEEMFSKLKEFLRHAAARTRDSLYDALGEALKLVSAEDILGWFRQAGLCASQG